LPSLHPLLASRWSPARFDATVTITGDEVDSILEAARWSPSAGNSQPWAFVVGVRGDDTHERIVPYLAQSSTPWAAAASLLLVNLSHRYVQDTGWEYSEFSLYDLGQAVAHMTVQAQSLGLASRQFRGFDRDGLARAFAVPPHWQITTMTAVGRAVPDSGRDQNLDGADRALRVRRPSDHLRWPNAIADPFS
jgi:nitroreductase